MATQSLGTTLHSNAITIYGGVSTVTYTITVTALGTLIPIASWPFASTPDPVEYSSIAFPTEPVSRYYPSSLPIFTATQVEIIVVNTTGPPIMSLVEVQAQPAYLYRLSGIGDAGTTCIDNSYTCWSPGKTAGIFITAILGGSVFLLSIIWLCYRRLRRPHNVDEESGHDMLGHDQNRIADRTSNEQRRRSRSMQAASAGQQRRQSIKRGHTSLPSGTYIAPPRSFPRAVVASRYPEEIKMTRLTQHVLNSETSTESTSRRAVVGFGLHDGRRNAVYFNDAEGPRFTGEHSATRRTTIVPGLSKAEATAIEAIPKIKTAPRARSNPDSSELENIRNSRTQGWVIQQERGRSRNRKSSTRMPPPGLQSHSRYRESDSPPTDNRNSFAPYAPVVVAVLEDLWERAERSTARMVQRNSSVHSSSPEAHSHRKPRRDDKNSNKHHRKCSKVDSRSMQQQIRISGANGETLTGSAPPISTKIQSSDIA